MPSATATPAIDRFAIPTGSAVPRGEAADISVRFPTYEPTFWDMYGDFIVRTGIVLIAALILLSALIAVYLYLRRSQA